VGDPSVKEVESQEGKAIEALIADLRSPNKDPNPRCEFVPEYPKEYDWEKQRRVSIAREKLTDLGKAAFSYLIAHRDDKQYSGPLKTGANPLRSLSVGDTCCMIICEQVDSMRGAYKCRKGRDGEEQGVPAYFSQFFKNRDDSPGNAFLKWWKEHQMQSLREMQIDALRWTVAQERSIGFPDKKEEEKCLQPLLKQLQEWTKKE
jgi:hypothetical protein